MIGKSIRTLVVTLILFAGVTNGPAVFAAGQLQISPDALVVARTYFDALQAGDRQVLLSLFAGRERSRNEAQLNDPTYSQFLADRYSNARLEIVDGGVKSGITYIDITIWINDTESVKERLILKPSENQADSTLHIVARKELNQ